MLATLLTLTGLLAARTFAQSGDLKCGPEVLYKGDTLTVELPAVDKPGDELAVYDGQRQQWMMLSFEPGPHDRIRPVIAPDVLFRMKELRLPTETARGSPAGAWQGDCVARVEGPPEPIFIRSGNYQVLYGGLLGFDDNEPYSCGVEYHNHRRGEPAPPETPRPPAAETARSQPTPRPAPATLECNPHTLYRGDTLTIRLPMPHDGDQLSVYLPRRGYDYQSFLLTFRPNQADTVSPEIAPERFAKLTTLNLKTTEVRGPRSGITSPCFPHVEGPPERIFTKSGSYQVLLGPTLTGEDPDYTAQCWVRYTNALRKGSGP